MSIGDRIKYLRKEAGMTQGELADMVGVSSVAISQWETDVRVPANSNLRILADIFNCNLDFLMGRTDKVPNCDYVVDGIVVETQPEKPELNVKRLEHYASVLKTCYDIFSDGTAIVEVWNDEKLRERLIAYAKKLLELKHMEDI